MSDPFDEWAVLELMGHRRLAGHVTEVEVAGTKFLRIDIPGRDGRFNTQIYSPGSVYCITPTSEITVRQVAEHTQPEPIYRWELQPVAGVLSDGAHYHAEVDTNLTAEDEFPF
jgi:hypothetical protein